MVVILSNHISVTVARGNPVKVYGKLQYGVMKGVAPTPFAYLVMTFTLTHKFNFPILTSTKNEFLSVSRRGLLWAYSQKYLVINQSLKRH